MKYDPSLSHFDLDLARGRTGELFVDDICQMLGNRSIEIEVKNDDKFEEYRRLYVEHECRGRDGVWRSSGLNVTKAKVWAFVVNNRSGVLIFETDWLRRAVALARKDPRNIKECKYGENPTRGVVVYLAHLASSMRRTES